MHENDILEILCHTTLCEVFILKIDEVNSMRFEERGLERDLKIHASRIQPY